MYKVFSTLFIICLWTTSLVAQGRIAGHVIDDETDDPVGFASVAVYALPDSNQVGGATTDIDGKFMINLKDDGRYFIRVQFVSFTPFVSPEFTIHAQQRFKRFKEIRLKPSTVALDEFVVKEEIEQVKIDGDKRVFNVEKDATVTGGTASDVMENLPAVTIDDEGNISLRGSQNVRIFINGRETGMTDFAILEQLPADAIEKVEIITNPSAKYDAEGSAGIINIVLKKNKRSGTNGMITAQAGYLHDHNTSITLNHGGKGFRLEGGYNVRYYENQGYSINNRTDMRNDTTTYLDQYRDFGYTRISHNLNLGGEYTISDKQSIGFKAIGMISDRERETFIDYENLDANRDVQGLFFRESEGGEFRYNYDFSITHDLEFDSSEHTLRSMVSYNAYEDHDFQNNTQFYDDVYGNSDGLFFFEQDEIVDQVQGHRNFIAQTDYERPLKSGKLEAGAKSAWRNVNSMYYAEWADLESGVFEPAELLNNEFDYEELVSAGYLAYRNEVDKLSFQLGMRGEHTMIEGDVVNTDQQFSKDYFNLFPSGFLGYKLADRHQLQLNVSRRINRPSMWALNPFVAFSDPLNIRQGNPDLDPEMTISSELNHIWSFGRNMLNTGLYHRYTDDVMQRFRTLDDDGVSRVVWDNLAKRHSVGADIFFNHNFTKKWRGNISFNGYYSEVYGENINPDFQVNFFSFFGRLSQTYNITEDLSIQANYFYRAPMETVQGRMLEIHSFDLAIKYQFWDEKATLTVRARDVFDTRRFRFVTEDPLFIIDTEYNRITQRFFLVFSYKFNNYKERRGRGEGFGGGDDFGM